MISSYDVAKVIQTAIKTAFPAMSVSLYTLQNGDTIPVVLIIPLAPANLEGSFDQPHEMGDIYVQISCIGGNGQQASGMQVGIMAMLLRRSGSGYTTPLLVNGHETIGRDVLGLGSVVPGDNVYRTDDTYSFKEMLI